MSRLPTRAPEVNWFSNLTQNSILYACFDYCYHKIFLTSLGCAHQREYSLGVWCSKVIVQPQKRMTVSNLGCRFFSDLDVGACIFKDIVPIETFNVSFENTQNKQPCGTKTTWTEIEKNFS